jgi:hypothetical protein
MKKPFLFGSVKRESAESASKRSKKRHMQDLNLERLREICQADIGWFHQFGTVFETPGGIYIYKDNGAKILSVCHLDTRQDKQHFRVRESRGEVQCPQLDDRLGAFVLLEMLPKLKIHSDLLFTVGEEHGNSTAKHFKSDKKYNWLMEPDRTGDDVVLYRYGDKGDNQWRKAITSCGFKLSTGSYTDISDMESLGCKAMNIGIGYFEYHSPQSYVRLDMLQKQLDKFQVFYALYKDTLFPHKKVEYVQSTWAGYEGTAGEYVEGKWMSHWEKEKLKDTLEAEVFFELDPEVEILVKGKDGTYTMKVPLSIACAAMPHQYEAGGLMITGEFKGRLKKSILFGYLAALLKENEKADNEAIDKELSLLQQENDDAAVRN